MREMSAKYSSSDSEAISSGKEEPAATVAQPRQGPTAAATPDDEESSSGSENDESDGRSGSSSEDDESSSSDEDEPATQPIVRDTTQLLNSRGTYAVVLHNHIPSTSTPPAAQIQTANKVLAKLTAKP